MTDPQAVGASVDEADLALADATAAQLEVREL